MNVHTRFIALVAVIVACRQGPEPVRNAPSLYCEGAVQWPAQTKLCRSKADCAGSQECLLDIPTPVAVCGACDDPSTECRTDSDCANDGVCEPGGELPAGSCRCTGAVGSHCEPRCTATSCGADQACGDDGHCTFVAPTNPPPPPLACWQGGSCGENQECVRDQGCAARRCKRDAECDCGTCVTGTCQRRPAVCMTPVPYQAPPP